VIGVRLRTALGIMPAFAGAIGLAQQQPPRSFKVTTSEAIK
jgi:hypothetical protein